ncbi:MAG: NADPH-dependent FMN reductase [Ardenticatenaceae bacterium]
MNVLAFAASNSRHSINKALVSYAATLINGDVEVIDINDYEMPLYSADREQAGGIPEQAHQFYDKIGQADAILISFAEHNGNVTAAYKNLFDWTSRINAKVYQGKPAVLLSTSPGQRGASNVLGIAKSLAPYGGLDVKAALSVASFYNNFDQENGRITNSDIQAQLETALATLN